MGSEKRSKRFKINGLGCFRDAFLGGPIWTIQIAKAFPCRLGLFFFRRSALVQHGADFAILYVPCGAPCWAQQGRQKHYKNNVLLLIFQMKGTLGAATKYIPTSKIDQICSEINCFVRLPWKLSVIHLGWYLFLYAPRDFSLYAPRGCSNGVFESVKGIKQMVWEVLGGHF